MSTKTKTLSNEFRLFANVKVLVITALFIAMSIVLGKFLSFKIGDVIRISFENLTLQMAGIFFGPLIGLVTGVVADILGCILYGYAINPIITIGAGLIGFISGLLYHYTFKNKNLVRTVFSVGSAHLIGSVVVKTIGLYLYYNTPFTVLAWRVPTYIIITVLECFIIYRLMKNKAFTNQLESVCKK